MTDDEVKEWLKDAANVSTCLPNNMTLYEPLPPGAQGVVYRGEVDGRPSAIKVYFPGHVEQRVQREVDALLAIECRCIVALHWAGSIQVDGRELQVVATELVEGTSLSEILKSRRLSHEELGVVAFDCCQAIESMWSRRIVHRDLKPSNIVMTSDNRAKVIDLGVARHLEHSSLTTMGVTWGDLWLHVSRTDEIRKTANLQVRPLRSWHNLRGSGPRQAPNTTRPTEAAGKKAP